MDQTHSRWFLITCGLLACLLSLSGCGSPTLEQRLARGEDELASWPVEVQELVAQGGIDVGFTREQVRMAWGEPERKTIENTAAGRFEVWIWEKKSPSLGIGLGVGSFGSRSGVSGGVGTTVGGRTNVLAVVRFQQGEVVSWERAA